MLSSDPRSPHLQVRRIFFHHCVRYYNIILLLLQKMAYSLAVMQWSSFFRERNALHLHCFWRVTRKENLGQF